MGLGGSHLGDAVAGEAVFFGQHEVVLSRQAAAAFEAAALEYPTTGAVFVTNPKAMSFLTAALRWLVSAFGHGPSIA